MNTAQFAARFSHEDWGQLCRNFDFNTACENGDFGVAEIIAHRILSAVPTVDSDHRNTAGRIEMVNTLHLPSAEEKLAKCLAMPNAPKAVSRAKREIASLKNEVAILTKKLQGN